MLGLKLNHVSKRGPRSHMTENRVTRCHMTIILRWRLEPEVLPLPHMPPKNSSLLLVLPLDCNEFKMDIQYFSLSYLNMLCLKSHYGFRYADVISHNYWNKFMEIASCGRKNCVLGSYLMKLGWTDRPWSIPCLQMPWLLALPGQQPACYVPWTYMFFFQQCLETLLNANWSLSVSKTTQLCKDWYIW